MCYVLLEKLANELASWNEEKGLQIHSKEKKKERCTRYCGKSLNRACHKDCVFPECSNSF